MIELIVPADTRAHLAAEATGSGYEVLNQIENPLLQYHLFAPRVLVEHDGAEKAKPAILRVIARGSAGVGIGNSVLHSSEAKELMSELASRQDQLCASLPGTHVAETMKAQSSMTCGMGQPTPFENGLMLLRPYGLPFVPASTWKGVMASWLAEILEEKLNLTTAEEESALRVSGLLPLFGAGGDALTGKGAARGTVTFMDALPLNATFEPDVTTVHHSEWYQGTGAPSGIENPVPIHFLTVARGSRFRFHMLLDAGVALPESLSDQRERLEAFGITDLRDPAGFCRQLLVSTARYKGFGAQTAVGYGRMEQ